MCTYRYIWYPPGAAYRTNCTGSPAKTRELLSLPLSLSHIDFPPPAFPGQKPG